MCKGSDVWVEAVIILQLHTHTHTHTQLPGDVSFHMCIHTVLQDLAARAVRRSTAYK